MTEGERGRGGECAGEVIVGFEGFAAFGLGGEGSKFEMTTAGFLPAFFVWEER